MSTTRRRFIGGAAAAALPIAGGLPAFAKPSSVNASVPSDMAEPPRIETDFDPYHTKLWVGDTAVSKLRHLSFMLPEKPTTGGFVRFFAEFFLDGPDGSDKEPIRLRPAPNRLLPVARDSQDRLLPFKVEAVESLTDSFSLYLVRGTGYAKLAMTCPVALQDAVRTIRTLECQRCHRRTPYINAIPNDLSLPACPCGSPRSDLYWFDLTTDVRKVFIDPLNAWVGLGDAPTNFVTDYFPSAFDAESVNTWLGTGTRQVVGLYSNGEALSLHPLASEEA